MSSVVQELSREGEATKALLENIRDILADDEEAKADFIEGETNLRQVLERAVCRLGEIDAMRDSIKSYTSEMDARAKRLSAQAEHIRTAIIAAMSAAEVRKVELPVATLSLGASPAKVVVISEADIPAQYWKRGDPTLDKRALLSDLKDKVKVPGAELSNGGEQLMVRRS